MKILEKQFKSRTFNFRQICREGDLAIYEKSKGNYLGYETIRIHSHTGYFMAGVLIPAAETFPGNESWGRDGFTAQSLDDARKYLQKMQKADKV